MEVVLFNKKYMIKNSGEQGVLVGKIMIDGIEYYIFEPDSYGDGINNCIKVTIDDLIKTNIVNKKK